MTVVDERPADPDRVEDIEDVPDDGIASYGGDLVPFDEPDPWQASPLRGPLERVANRPLPTPRQLAASGRWWTVNLSKAGGQVLLHSPELVLHQVPHVLRGIGKWASAYARWRAQADWLAAAKDAEPKDRAKRMGEVHARRRAHTRITFLALALAAGGAIAAVRFGYGELLIGIVIGVLVVADLIGRREAPTDTATAVMPRSSFQEGAPTRMVVADVHAVLVEQGHDPERTAVTEPRVGEFGVSMQVHSPHDITEEAVYAIERGLQTYRGAVSIVGDPSNAAVCELRMYWRDPLAVSMVPPLRDPLSQTISVPCELGYGIGKVPLLLNFKRTNVLMVGGPGSGKSSALWTIIDYLSTCQDVVLHAIDLSGGPMARAWGHVFATRAFHREDVKALLLRNLARAKARTEYLAERSEPREDGTVPGSENWECADGKFHITIIDELPLLAADPELRALYAEHQRIGRKAGDTSVAVSQDLGGDTLQATSLRKYPSTTIMFACSREDTTIALGGGKIKEGWTPHRFIPAEGDAENDAGKCFIWSGRHNRPVPWRFFRLDDMGEIHRRAIARMQAGRPTDDAEPVEVVESATVVPPVLAAMAQAFREDGDPAFIPTAELLPRVCAIVGQKLTGEKLSKQSGVKPGRPRHDGAPTRGYLYSDVRAALDAL